MIIYKDELYVIGYFLSAGNIPCANIAKWNGSRWCSLEGQFDNVINTITSYHDSLFIGGGFRTINSDSMNCFSKWIGGNFSDTCGILFTDVDEQNETNLINIFPNPGKDEIQILSRELELKKVLIKNIFWKENFRGNYITNPCRIDISFLTSGLYFLIIETKEGRVIKKFVKD